MIIKFCIIQNDYVSVAYSSTIGSVTVAGIGNTKQKMFAGWDSLPDLFDTFSNSMSDNTSYEDAIAFFSPNIGDVVITNLNDKK
jgi:hypothetical protein